MLSNYILQTTSAPGTGTASLIAAPTGRRNFNSKFTTGQVCFYFLDDGTQSEWGYGTLTTGTPDTLSRDTVLGNSSGTTSKLNFTGLTRMYNDLPAEATIYKNNSGIVALPLTTITDPANTLQQLTLTGGSAGACIKLVGTATNPTKYVRAFNGSLQILNNAASAAILGLTDAGALTIAGTFTPATGGSGGYSCRTGYTGTTQGNVFNLGWNGSSTVLYIDTTNLGTINTTSDARYKQQIVNLPDTGLDRINALRPISYQWQDKGIFRNDGQIHEGLIAQEVQQIIPSAVHVPDDDESPLTLNEMPIIAVLVKAVQELSAKVAALEAKLP